MDRLTRKSDNSSMVWFIDREHESEYTEKEPCEMDSHHARLAIAKLAEYEDLEEQGKLLKLPCAVGDTVYVLRIDNSAYMMNNEKAWEIVKDKFEIFHFDSIGKTVFLTKSAAEAALKEMSE